MSENQGHNEGFHVLPEIVCEAIPASSPDFKLLAPPCRESRKLFTVEERFHLQDRGTILCPGFKPEPDERFRMGDRIRLRRPDGSEVRVTIDGLDFFHPGPNGECAVLIAMPESDVPIGTEVWSM